MKLCNHPLLMTQNISIVPESSILAYPTGVLYSSSITCVCPRHYMKGASSCSILHVGLIQHSFCDVHQTRHVATVHFC